MHLNIPWHETVIYEAHVKGFTKQRDGVREDLRGTYGGPGGRGRDRLPQVARRDGGRAAAGAPHHRRGLPARPRAHELLGLLDDRLPRAALRILGDRHAGARVQGHGEGAAPRRDRGDPRRRLQPHRRGQPPRPDAQLPRRRQRELLPPRARDAALLHGLHGHGQHAQPGAPDGAAADHGLAALLRDRLPRRRLPLRSRVGARARVLRGRSPVGLLRHHPPGSDPLPGEADRRAVGRRPGRLPGRQLPDPLVGVERHLPRHDARLLARPGAAARLRLALRRLGRPLPDRRPPAVRVDQLHHRARRVHAARPRLVQREAQRGERRGQPRRHRRQPLVELRRRRADRRSAGERAARAPAAELPRDALALAGRADAARRRRAGPHAGRQQQRVVPGQRDLVVQLGAVRPGAARVLAAADRASSRASRLPAHEVLRRQGRASARTCGGCGPTAGA